MTVHYIDDLGKGKIPKPVKMKEGEDTSHYNGRCAVEILWKVAEAVGRDSNEIKEMQDQIKCLIDTLHSASINNNISVKGDGVSEWACGIVKGADQAIKMRDDGVLDNEWWGA